MTQCRVEILGLDTVVFRSPKLSSGDFAMHKSAIKMIGNPEHTFDPPGRCIYCPSTGDPDLHREHIIPKALRGRLVFRKASCAQCGSETHAFEGRVINRLFGGARHVTGMQPTKDASLKVFFKGTSGEQQQNGSRSFDVSQNSFC